MNLLVNGRERDVAVGSTIDGLLQELDIPPERPGTAVARNDEIVPKNRWSETTLTDGDRIEIIAAVQGG